MYCSIAKIGNVIVQVFKDILLYDSLQERGTNNNSLK